MLGATGRDHADVLLAGVPGTALAPVPFLIRICNRPEGHGFLVFGAHLNALSAVSASPSGLCIRRSWRVERPF